MAVGVKQYVFRFDVPVNNFFFVEVLHPQANLDKVEPGLFFGHFADLSEQKEELSSWAELKDEHQLSCSFKSCV